jgi:hypothetical protein
MLLFDAQFQDLKNLPRENHPTIEGRRSLLTAAARLDSHGVRCTRDQMAKANLFFDDEARKPHTMSRTRSLSGWRGSYRFFFFHDGFLPVEAAFRT